MSTLNTNFDNDFDSFLNLESNDFTPIVSPAPKSVPTLSHQNSQQSFSGPSYQYDSHRQQTGLPMGGLANAFAVNQASGMHYRPNSMGYVMPTETLNIPLASNLDDFDFNRNQSMDMTDMDFDADSPSDVSSMFYNGESSQSAPIQRIYPGMHSQQAAQAKAAQAMKQQMMQHQQKQLAGQQPLPTQAAKAPAPKDPHVEESISRLLNRMRQSSSVSAGDDDAASNSGMNLSKTKKEEEDMDEDERLLASEEGKKLSSKERRQLRNKVSARAFRSRRKEYITQLEAEVQQKAQEANDLRVQNRQLMEENTRLTDLSRMLLSSQAFSGFLQELSNSGLPAPQINLPVAPTSQPAHVRKDVGAHEAARQLQSQNQPQVNLVTIPETNMSGLDNWNALPNGDFQVFSLTSLPQPPTLDLMAMSEKKPVLDRAVKPSLDLSTLPPPIESAAPTKVDTSRADACVTSMDTELDLYLEPTHITTISQPSLSPSISRNKSTSSPKASTGSGHGDVSSSWSELANLCAQLDETCERIADLMPQLK